MGTRPVNYSHVHTSISANQKKNVSHQGSQVIKPILKSVSFKFKYKCVDRIRENKQMYTVVLVVVVFEPLAKCLIMMVSPGLFRGV